jgi:hypothetical protein
MRILFDQGTPAPLRQSLPSHEVKTAFEIGWAELKNGDLLAKADGDFDLLVTTDRNLNHQQNLAKFNLATLVLPTTSWPELREHTGEISETVDAIQPSDYLELKW